MAAQARKAPRRTALRILEVTLALFNRFGEPNVSTTLITKELRISPGNLYYHYPAKGEIINALFDRYALELGNLLQAAGSVHDVEDAWFFTHSLIELIWQYRFLYRDINDLLSKNRHLEKHFQAILEDKMLAISAMLQSMQMAESVALDPQERPIVATSMVLLLTYWLSYEYVRNPRHALEPEQAQQALLRGAKHVLHLLSPYLEAAQRTHAMQLANAYTEAS